MTSCTTYCICGRCKGTGIGEQTGTLPAPEDPCTGCGGAGYYLNLKGYLPPKTVNTYEISDALDVTEYGELPAGNQAAVNIILSMGIVSLVEGTNSRVMLWALFDAESTTRANLITLLGE